MRVRSVIPLLAAGAVALAAAAPASAFSLGRSGPPRRGLEARSGTLEPVSSEYFAGYEADIYSDSGQTVTSTMVVPKIKKCTNTDQGLGVGVSLDVNEGDTYSVAGMFVGCYKGKPDYYPFLTINGTETNYTKTAAHPGDKVVMTVSVTDERTVVLAQDKKAKFKERLAGEGELEGAGYPEVGDGYWYFHDDTLAGVPKFGKLSFSDSKVDGESFVAAADSDLVQYDRYSSSSKLEIATGPFASNGESFKTIFKSSS